MMQLWTEERWLANEDRIEALVARTGKPHLHLWREAEGPDWISPRPAEWVDTGADEWSYGAVNDWCVAQDRRDGRVES